MLLAGASASRAQQANIGCSLTSAPVIAPAFGALSVNGTATGLGYWSPFANPVGNVIDNSTSNRAEATIIALGSATLTVSDGTYTYPSGNYAGFVIGFSGLNVNALSGVTLRTYLGATLQETVSSASLLGVSLGANLAEVGFYTNKPYSRIEITYTSVLNVGSTFDVYYAVMRGTGSCTSLTAAPCNVPVRPRFANYASVIDPLKTGISGVSTTAWTGLENVVDADTTNAASLGIAVSVSALSTASLAVKNTVAEYPQGYFAGFDIQNTGLLSISALNNLTINTYRNDTLVGTASGTNLLLGATLFGTVGRQTVGFVAPQAFDEVQLVIAQPVSVNLGTTLVYGAVIRNFCAGPTPPCNIPVAQKEATHPAYINTGATGFTGTGCVACSIDSIGNLLDGDTLNAATVSMTAGALATGTIAVRNGAATYPTGTYAGFEIASPTLLNLGVLSNISVAVYRGGVLKQTFSGNGLLVSVPSSLLGGTSRYNIGFLADSSFDEVRLNLAQTVSVNLGVTYVYRALIERFCPGTLLCNTTNWLNAPAQSVFIDRRETGTTGAACALCTVTNPDNAISTSTTDFAQLVTVASVAASTSLAVKDAVTTYPAGSIAGFAVQDPNNVLQLNLLQTITISTFNDGIPQESATASQLLNLSLLVLQLNPSTGYYNLGMRTTLPFDEVKISITPLAGVVPVLNVYGAYVDTRYVTAINATLPCALAPVIDPDHFGTPKNTTAVGSLRTNDRDPGNLALTYSTTPTVAPKHGVVTINQDGTFSYVPALNYVGLDSFYYTACNTDNICAGGWAYASVLDSRVANGPNTPHIVQPDRSETMVNVPVTGNAAANDIDVEQRPMTYTITTQPLHGTLSMTPNGQYVYTPESSYIGLDSALVTVCDTATPQICRSSRLLLVIRPGDPAPNDRPYAFDDVSATRRGLPVNGNVLTNDKDPDNDPLTAQQIGTVPGTSGIFSLLSNGNWTFSPAAGFIGNVSVPYRISDGAGGFDTATLNITVVPYVGPDYTPTISIASLGFPTAGQPRDFRVDLIELQNSVNEGQLVVRVVKPSALDVMSSDTITTVSVGGSSFAVSNANWNFTENASFVTCTLKPGIVLPASSIHSLGFRLSRKAGIPVNTSQNITVSIGNTTGGDGNNGNNQYTTTVTAQ